MKCKNIRICIRLGWFLSLVLPVICGCSNLKDENSGGAANESRPYDSAQSENGSGGTAGGTSEGTTDGTVSGGTAGGTSGGTSSGTAGESVSGENETSTVVSMVPLGARKPNEGQKTSDGTQKNTEDAANSNSNQSAQTPEGNGLLGKKETVSVRYILERMVSVYHSAKNYRDNGEILISWNQNGKPYERKVDYRTNLQRPNRLLLQVNETEVLADGTTFSAYTPEMPEMFLQKSCPAEIHLLDILNDQEIYWALTDVESNQFSYLPPPLVLLLAPDPLLTFLYRADPSDIVLLEPLKFDDRDCFRIELQRNGEQTILWIDSESFLLRRVELPHHVLQNEDASKSSSTDEMVVTLNFHDAELNWEGTLEIVCPPHAAPVTSYTAPQMELLGRSIPDFLFVGLDGRQLAPQNFQNKNLFLFFWSVYESNPYNFQDIERLYQQFKNRDGIVFLGVNIDPAAVPNEKIRSTIEKYGLTCDIARDKGGKKTKVLYNSGAFTCFLIDKKGVVQLCDTLNMYHPCGKYDEPIREVLDGTDIYPERIHELKRAEQDYRESIRLWIEKGIFLKEADTVQIEIAQKKIAPPSEPVVYKKKKLWSLTDVHAPAVVRISPDEKSILILENGNCIVETLWDGKIAARHPFALEKEEYLTDFQIFAHDSDVFYAAAGKRAYIFDSNWKILTVYPPKEQKKTAASQNAVSNMVFDDLEADGKPELYITFWNESSIHKVTLDGKISIQAVSDGTGIQNVFQMSAVKFHSEKSLWCVDQKGIVTIFDPKTLQSSGVVDVEGRTLGGIAAADFDSNGDDSLAALAMGVQVRYKALGIARDGKELWSLDLPNFIYQRPIEKIHPVFLKDSSESMVGWVLIGADSSIYMVDRDGMLIDQFNFGKIITGCCTGIWNQKAVLLVATPDDVSAWEFSH